MFWVIIVWAVVVLCTSIGTFFVIDYGFTEARLVEIIRNMSIIAAGAISFPAVLYSLWIKKKDLTIKEKDEARRAGDEGDYSERT